MILFLLQIIYVAVGLFWFTVFCFRKSVVKESIGAIPTTGLKAAELFFQSESGRLFTQLKVSSTGHNLSDSAIRYDRYQIWGLIPGILGTTLFATIACGYLDQFEPGWLQTWYMQLILISGAISLFTPVALTMIAERFFTIKIFFAYLLITCIVIQMNIIHFLWLL